jgi:hypothetical protein
MQIEAGAARVELQGRTKQQFCVPAVAIRGNSYRLKDKLKAGLVRPEEPATVS